MIGGENSRKPVFGFRLSGEGLFCKGLGLNALPKKLNPHGAAILTTINPIAGAIGAAFFVGATNIGEKLSSAASPQQAMLDGIHLAMGSALLLGAVMVFFAMRLKQHQTAS